jgi:hypothetical protein
MFSTRALISVLVFAALLTPARPSLAQKKQPVKFPMQSSEFRPLLDKIISQLEAAAATARAQGEKVPDGFASEMRFRGSQAMEDGVVTEQEFEYVMAAAD